MPEPSTTFEAIQEPRPIIMAQSQRGKSVLTAQSEVLAYPDIPDTAHEFGALLQFNTTYELMEFLATQQIKVSQRMAEEHEEQQMIERALTHRAEIEDEEPLAKVGRKRNAGIRRVGIELPPLNTALVEVHRELAHTTIGAKDMATKNTIVWKTVKRTKEELQKPNARIAELELGIVATSQLGESTDNSNPPQTLGGTDCYYRRS